MNKKIIKSLKLQMLCAVLVSFLIAIVTFGISFGVGNILLDQTVYGDSYVEKMTRLQFEKLQDYVKEEELSLNNLQRLNAWCSRGEKVYLAIYHKDTLIYEFSDFAKIKNETNVVEFDPELEDADNEFLLELQGGIKVRTFLYYYAGDAFYFGIVLMAGIMAFVVFSLSFISLINRKVTYISQLRKELDIISGGQLAYAITIEGKDELGELAFGIEQMRCSIIQHQEMEEQIRTANSELITAMSHDLRTPLTSLLAYLEIIERKKYADEEQMHNLVHKSVEQTMRIKNMADKLFEYFFMYATEWEDSETETMDADQLFYQILEDFVCSLESKEMTVKIEFIQVSQKIAINIELLHRVFDNLYSNLIKYADRSHPIELSYQKKDEFLVLTMRNKINLPHEKNDSTGIGLSTCKRLMKYIGGIFTIDRTDDFFCAQMCIPLKR